MSESKKKTVFVASGDAETKLYVKKAIEKHYNYVVNTCAAELFGNIEKQIPDIILWDIDMDGYGTLKSLNDKFKSKPMPPVILLTEEDDTRIHSEEENSSLGVVDCITNSFSQEILLSKIEMHLRIKASEEQIRELHNDVLKAMANMVEAKDKYTGGHIKRTKAYLEVLINAIKDNDKYNITEYKEKINEYKKDLESWNIELILQSAPLHDLGKIAVEDAILNKPAEPPPPLTAEEFEMIKKHPAKGKDVIDEIMGNTGKNEFLDYAKKLVFNHHEKWNGKGYPQGLSGEKIPLLGRLMAIADVYDALVSERSYKKAFSHDKAVEIIEKDSGKHFDPALIELFGCVKNEFRKIAEDKENQADTNDENPVITQLYKRVNSLTETVGELKKEIEKKEAENKYVRGEIKKIAEEVEKIADRSYYDENAFDGHFAHVGIEGAEYQRDTYWGMGYCDEYFTIPPKPIEDDYDDRSRVFVCTNDEVAHLSRGLNRLLRGIKSIKGRANFSLSDMVGNIYKNGLDHITDNGDGDSTPKGLNLYKAILDQFKPCTLDEFCLYANYDGYASYYNKQIARFNDVVDTIFVVSHYTEEEIRNGHFYFEHDDGWFYKEEECFDDPDDYFIYTNSGEIINKTRYRDLLFMPEIWGRKPYRFLPIKEEEDIFFEEHGVGYGYNYVTAESLDGSNEHSVVYIGDFEVGDDDCYKHLPSYIHGLKYDAHPNCWKITVDGEERKKSIYIPKSYDAEKILYCLMNDAIDKLYSENDKLCLENNKLRLDNEILNLEKDINDGKSEITEEKYNLSSLVTGVIDRITNNINIKNKRENSHIKFIVNIDSNLPRELLGDRLEIQYVLNSLLTNAVKYAQEGDVSLNISETDRTDDHTTISIMVESSGKGMDDKEFARAKKSVEAMGGKMDESKGKKGCGAFTVTLPQNILDRTPVALVNNPKEKSVLVYLTEHNEYVYSITGTLGRLGISVSYAKESEFSEKLKDKPTFIFAATAALAGNAKKICGELNLCPQIVQLAMFCETAADKDIVVLDSPAYSITIADVLNGNAKATAFFAVPNSRSIAFDDKRNKNSVKTAAVNKNPQYLEQREAFRETWLEKIGKLKNPLETNGMENYMATIKRLKASATKIGEDELYERAEALLAAGNRLRDADNPEDREFIKSHNPELIQLLESILDNIGNYLKEKAGGEAT